MAKKTDKKMTLRYWAKLHKTSQPVFGAVKQTAQLDGKSRITDFEYVSLIDGWMQATVGEKK